MRRYVSATQSATQLASRLAQVASDKHGSDIVALDVSQTLTITDIFLIISAGNPRLLAAIIDAIDDAAGSLVLRREGEAMARWVLLDLADVVVHVMLEEDRQLYSLERLWQDAPQLTLDLT